VIWIKVSTERKFKVTKLNCWEIKKCNREPGGSKTSELGVCPAAVANNVNGINGGKNGGRACWAIAGTLCGGKTQGSFATKLTNCMACEFYQSVKAQEGSKLISSKEILGKL